MNSELACKQYEEIGHYIRHLNDLRSRGMYYTMLIFGALLTVGAAVLSAEALGGPQKEWIIGAICTFGALSALAPVMSERQMVQHFDMLVRRGRDLENEHAHTGQYTIALNSFGRPNAPVRGPAGTVSEGRPVAGVAVQNGHVSARGLGPGGGIGALPTAPAWLGIAVYCLFAA